MTSDFRIFIQCTLLFIFKCIITSPPSGSITSSFLCLCELRVWQEMASAELKEIRKALTKESIREHQLSKVGGTETDMFICGKCRGKNCTYTQVCCDNSHQRLGLFHNQKRLYLPSLYKKNSYQSERDTAVGYTSIRTLKPRFKKENGVSETQKAPHFDPFACLKGSLQVG